MNNYYRQRFVDGRTLSEQRRLDERAGTKAYNDERRRALKEQRKADKNSYRIQRAERKALAKDNRYELSKARAQVAQEQWIARQNEKFDRAQERQARKLEKRTARLTSGNSSRSEAERLRIDDRNTSKQRKRRGKRGN